MDYGTPLIQYFIKIRYKKKWKLSYFYVFLNLVKKTENTNGSENLLKCQKKLSILANL